MPPPTLREKRRAAGLCITCGAERTGKNGTTRFCAGCAERERLRCRHAYAARNPDQIAADREQQRTFQQKQRAARIAQNRCTNCGGPRVSTARRRATAKACGKCREKATAASTAFRQRNRRKKRGTPPDREPTIYYLGSAAPSLDGGHVFRLSVDLATCEAILRIKQRYREAEIKAGRTPRTHQLSRLMRELLVRWENGPCLPLETPQGKLYEKKRDVHLRLDARSRAVLEKQAAQNFDGNRSRALRALIIRGLLSQKDLARPHAGGMVADAPF